MKLVSIEQLHKDHVEWTSYVDHWKVEIRFLTNLLTKVYDKKFESLYGKEVKEQINTLDHHTRYLNEIAETINTHEAFMKDFMQTEHTRVNHQELLDHYKTRDRMLEFYKKFKLLKEKVFILAEKFY